MEKRSHNDTADAKLLIEKDDIEVLMRSERWHTAPEEGAHQIPEGISDTAAELCRIPHVENKHIDIEKLTEITSDDIIDRFLRADNYRIVADEEGPAEEIRTEAEFDGEDDLASEELAEVYIAQGLKDMAKETYRKLSLLNPEKSVYFAELIAKLDADGPVTSDNMHENASNGGTDKV